MNGTGKTTTSAKMAYRLNEEGYSVSWYSLAVLTIWDTFRAGAIDQPVTDTPRKIEGSDASRARGAGIPVFFHSNELLWPSLVGMQCLY